jgi:isopentenyldiphosphate isomerase
LKPEEELFDLCDEWGRPLGRTKLRSLVHRDGDWHRAFHCWLVDIDTSAEATILLQRRAFDKDTNPGLWDVSVGGHYSAGEGLEGGLREIREELGLDVAAHELVLAGWHREARHASGPIDREVQDVYFLFRPVDLRTLRPDPREVIAVARLPATAFARLADGSVSRIGALGGPVDSRGRVDPATIELVQAELLPRADGYYARAAGFAVDLVLGRPRAEPSWW